MSELRVNMVVSLDGYTAGPQQSAENPFGLGGMQLNEWLFPRRAFREMRGGGGGEDNPSGPIVEGWLESIGATVMTNLARPGLRWRHPALRQPRGGQAEAGTGSGGRGTRGHPHQVQEEP